YMMASKARGAISRTPALRAMILSNSIPTRIASIGKAGRVYGSSLDTLVLEKPTVTTAKQIENKRRSSGPVRFLYFDSHPLMPDRRFSSVAPEAPAAATTACGRKADQGKKPPITAAT